MFWSDWWFHSNHLNDKSGKMSKSKGAVLTVSVLKENGYDPLVYRFFCLQSHYRKPLEFSYEALDNVTGAFNKLIKRIADLKEEGSVDEAVVKKFEDDFRDALSDDLNTSMAITLLYDILKADTSDATKLAVIKSFDTVLSLDLLGHAAASKEEKEVDPELEAYVLDAIERRAAAKKAKDFATADAIRDELLQKGVEIKDTREGVKWQII